MPATLASELPSNIVAIAEIEETQASRLPTETESDTSICALCPPETPQPSVAECYDCEKKLCKTHNVQWEGWCHFTYDACPDCAAKRTENRRGVNFKAPR